MHEIKPDHDILEEKPKDWFPFILGMGSAIVLAVVVVVEIFMYLG